ncbi:MAG TPA: CdaR family protein [Candidatus Sulfopaludibacter sp.]|jgi:hypothetical protein|nr:CdaR family protein [Candidatus Sulfopaludibacter sp.]
MRRSLQWLLGLVFVNFWWKVLSLVLAVALWALVASEPELGTLATVALEYKNLPDDLEIASDSVAAVGLDLRGPSGELRGVGDSGLRPAVILDMANVLPGWRTFTIGDGNLKLPRGVRLMRANPSQVRFLFERRVTRDVPVVVKFTGVGANGYVIASQSVSPTHVTVVGPASHVARVTEASTDPVDVSGVVGSSEFRPNAYVNDPYVRFQTSPEVTVTVTMKKR